MWLVSGCLDFYAAPCGIIYSCTLSRATCVMAPPRFPMTSNLYPEVTARSGGAFCHDVTGQETDQTVAIHRLQTDLNGDTSPLPTESNGGDAERRQEPTVNASATVSEGQKKDKREGQKGTFYFS